MEINELEQQLWLPNQGMELHHEYPVPSEEELLELWAQYDPDAELTQAPSVYGVVRVPAELPYAVVSVDVCEVLRKSHMAFKSVEDMTDSPVEVDIFKYGNGLSVHTYEDVTSILQVLMSRNLVQPVDDIGPISQLMQGWRKAGAYVVANTSTLPGCEAGTIDFFKTYLPNCFDGLLLPRNHDGSLPLTKGGVIRNLLAQLTDTYGEAPALAVHIDDAPHHLEAVINEAGRDTTYQTATFAPYYNLTIPLPSSTIVGETPLKTFELVDELLNRQQT